MTVSDSDSDAISGIYRHSFIDNNDKNKCKKMGCRTPKSPTALSTQKRYL